MAYSPAERPKRLVNARLRKDEFFSPRSVDASQLDRQYPSARIRRLEAKSPHFRSNRKGWRKFYIWQERMGHRVWLTLRIERRLTRGSVPPSFTS